MRTTHVSLTSAGFLAVLATLSIASGEPIPNLLPETDIVATPPPNCEQDCGRICLFWNGSDEDGEVVGFLWAWDDPDDTHFTAFTDTCFILTEGTHTFYIAAVDDEGGQDPTPATFTYTIPVATSQETFGAVKSFYAVQN